VVLRAVPLMRADFLTETPCVHKHTPVSDDCQPRREGFLEAVARRDARRPCGGGRSGKCRRGNTQPV